MRTRKSVENPGNFVRAIKGLNLLHLPHIRALIILLVLHLPSAAGFASPDQALAPPARPFSADLELSAIHEKQILGLGPTVSFYFNSAVLRPEGLKDLDLLALWLKAHPEVLQVSIVGHTGQLGSPAQNLTLSRERARSIRRYLRHQGVDNRRMLTAGHGEQRPVAAERTVEDRIKNQRIEVHIDRLAPNLSTIKTTYPSATSPAFFTLKRANSGEILKPKITKLRPGDVVTAGKSPVTIKNGPTRFTLMPFSQMRLIRSSHDYNIKRRTFVVPPANPGLPRNESPWVQALKADKEKEADEPPEEPEKRTLVTRTLKAGVIAVTLFKGTLKVKAKQKHDVLLLYRNGLAIHQEGNATFARAGNNLKMTAEANAASTVYQDEHSTSLSPNAALVTSLANDWGYLVPLPAKDKATVRLHFTKSNVGVPEQVILSEYEKIESFLKAIDPDGQKIQIPTDHKQSCRETEAACILASPSETVSDYVLALNVAKTEKSFRTSFSLLSTTEAKIMQQAFHKFKGKLEDPLLNQKPHQANSALAAHQQENGPSGKFLRPQLGQDQEQAQILVLSWNHDPPRYESVSWTGHKMTLAVLEKNPKTNGLDGRHLKQLLDEHEGCENTDGCLEELTAAYGADFVLDGDLVQNPSTPLETDFELRLFEKNMMLAVKDGERFRPVSKVLHKVEPMVNEVLEEKELEDPKSTWRATMPETLRLTAAVGAGMGLLSFAAGSVSYIQYLIASSQITDERNALEERQIAYEAGTKAVNQYHSYGAGLQIFGGVLGITSAAIFGLAHCWPFAPETSPAE